MDAGPVAVVGFVRISDDMCVLRLLERLREQVHAGRCDTVGELVRACKRGAVGAPRSMRENLVLSFMMQSGRIASEGKPLDYGRAVRKNNALLERYGDPATTLVVP